MQVHNVEVLNMDLLGPLRARLFGNVDVLVGDIIP